MKDLHRINITIPDGETVLSRIEIDGQLIKGVTAFVIDVDYNRPRYDRIRLDLSLIADIYIEGDAEIAYLSALPPEPQEATR